MAGENVLGVWLGNGIQNAPYGDVWGFEKASYRGAPKVALALLVDGELVLESDESFLTKPSPIIFDDLRAGEHYDARWKFQNGAPMYAMNTKKPAKAVVGGNCARWRSVHYGRAGGKGAFPRPLLDGEGGFGV